MVTEVVFAYEMGSSPARASTHTRSAQGVSFFLRAIASQPRPLCFVNKKRPVETQRSAMLSGNKKKKKVAAFSA